MKRPKLKITLFWKILLWFWFILVTVFSLNLFLTQVSNENTRYRSLPPHLHQQLIGARHKLYPVLERKRFKQRKRSKFLRNTFLLDQDGADYFGRKVPEMLLLLDQRIKKNKKPASAFKKKFLYFGGLEMRIDDKDYRLYLSQNFSILSRGYFSVFVREFAHNLLVSIFFVSFPLSFLLAWFFTRPIKKLQEAIGEITDDLGDRDSLNQLSKRTDEFGDLAKDFSKMASHIESAISSKDRLLSDVSHELKSPLARLQISLGLAYKKQTEQNYTELDRIKLEADRMNAMVTSLLEYSKLEHHELQQELKTIELDTFLKSVTDDAEFEGKANGIIVKTEFASNISLSAQPSMLLSCFENVLRNAIRYATNEVIVRCKLDQENNSVLIEIIDDGCGVPNEQLEKIFDAFYRPESDRSRLSGGVGLGLSIAKKVIDAHEGKIVAKNVEPTGLAICIQLPVNI
jgi:two-component system sensor histidine kinase CpxA